MRFKKILKKTWRFIWHDDSLLSWIINIILAFILVKFIIYPGIGFLLTTSHPLVAVVSGSMEHNMNFEDWWNANKNFYINNDIERENFKNFSFLNGFNKGDIMILYGVKPKDIKMGTVIVYQSNQINPIIHRVIGIKKESNKFYFKTKGDNNSQPDPGDVEEGKIIGKAIFRIPFLGWVKIWFTDLINLLR